MYLESDKLRHSTGNDPYSPVARQTSWRLNSSYARPMQLVQGEQLHELSILEQDGGYDISLGGARYKVSATLHGDTLDVIINGHRRTLYGYRDNSQLTLMDQGEQFSCQLHVENFGETDHQSDASLAAPMNGAVVAVLVEPGQAVSKGDTLVVMEAMKMEHSIRAPRDGIVSAVFFAEGELVADGAELVSLAIETEEAS
jgi:3-methylcrotonyl-CoA carboxylase alpha subunit